MEMVLFDKIYEGLIKNITQSMEDEDLAKEIRKGVKKVFNSASNNNTVQLSKA